MHRELQPLGDTHSADVGPVDAQLSPGVCVPKPTKNFARSNGLDDLDALIAATTEHHRLELATPNVRHFPMFKRLKAAY